MSGSDSPGASWERGREEGDLEGKRKRRGEERMDWGEGLCPTVRVPCGGARC